MTKVQTHEVEIQVPVEAAWRALTDPEELARWFVEEARVEPRVGGSFRVSWGEDAWGEARIEEWEPNRRLRLVQELPGDDAVPPPDEPLVQEWTFESRGGATLVRLVQSGFPDTEVWAGIYDSMELGWGLFFRNLRHYVENHRGRRRQSRYLTARSERTTAEVWRAVTGPGGLGANGRLPAAGERYELAGPDGGRLSGSVVHHEPGRALQLTLEPLDDGLLTLAVEGDEEGTLTWATVATFGDSAHEPADRLAERLRGLVS